MKLTNLLSKKGILGSSPCEELEVVGGGAGGTGAECDAGAEGGARAECDAGAEGGAKAEGGARAEGGWRWCES